MDETLGMRIRVARIRRGLTQKALAAQAGLTQQQICNIERNGSRPGAASLRALAVSLQVSTDYLVGLAADEERACLRH
jgi:transcriptional regulator with XRE-family HTH domain